MGIGPTQQHDPKDDEGWQEARRKSANKGNKNVSIATIRMPTNNGFDPLWETNTQADKGKVDMEGLCNYGRNEGRPQSSQHSTWRSSHGVLGE